MDTENKKQINCLKSVRMKGLKTPALLVSMKGWFHAKRGKVSREGKEVSSGWLEQKQRDFNAYCAELFKMTGSLLLPFRKELEALQDTLKEEGKKQSVKEDEAAELTSQTIKEKRAEAALKKEIQSIKATCESNGKRIKELIITIDELEHESFQLLQKTKEQAESKMLAYLQGAGILRNRQNLLGEAIKETELYQRYCSNKKQNIGEREVGDDV